MVYQIINLEVGDYNTWRPIHDEFTPLREKYGQRSNRVLVNPDDKNKITLIIGWEDPARMQEYFQLSEVGDAMERASVQRPPEIMILNQAEGKLA